MSGVDCLQPGPGVPQEIIDQVAGELPLMASLWRDGPLHLVPLDDSEAPSTQDVPGEPWQTVTFLPAQTVEARLPDAHTLLIRTPGGGCRLETRNNLSIAYWGDVSRTALYLATIEAVRARNAVMLHACGYVASGAQTLTAVVGLSGSGKSTHLLRQVAEGARPVSEDMLWLNVASGECTSTDRHVRLLPDNIHAALQSASSAGTGGIKQLWEIPWARGDSDAPARLGVIGCLENFQLRPLSSLPPLIQVKHLWEALGQPLLPAARRTHESWVASVVSSHLVATKQQ